MKTTIPRDQVYQTNKPAPGLRHAIRAGVVLMGAAALLMLPLMTTLQAAGNRSDVNPGVLPPQSHPYGKTYAEWAAEWLKFVYSVPFDHNPQFDFSLNVPLPGVVGQSGAVSFPISSDAIVPAGQGIFLQVFRVNLGTCPGNPDPFVLPAPGQTIEERLTELAQIYNDAVTELTVEIDGVRLKNPFQYRASSGVLSNLAFGPGYEDFITPCGPGPGEHQDIVEGFWLMLAPLPKGQHTIHVAFAQTLWDLSVEYVLHITVE